jgi:putative oxidoreductase
LSPHRLLTAVLKPNLELNTGFQIASTVLRVVVGVVMVHNGWDKLSDIESFAQAYVEYIGLPFPIFLSYVAGFSIPYLELSALYAACFLFFVINGAGSFVTSTIK